MLESAQGELDELFSKRLDLGLLMAGTVMAFEFPNLYETRNGESKIEQVTDAIADYFTKFFFIEKGVEGKSKAQLKGQHELVKHDLKLIHRPSHTYQDVKDFRIDLPNADKQMYAVRMLEDAFAIALQYNGDTKDFYPIPAGAAAGYRLIQQETIQNGEVDEAIEGPIHAWMPEFMESKLYKLLPHFREFWLPKEESSGLTLFNTHLDLGKEDTVSIFDPEQLPRSEQVFVSDFVNSESRTEEGRLLLTALDSRFRASSIFSIVFFDKKKKHNKINKNAYNKNDNAHCAL